MNKFDIYQQKPLNNILPCVGTVEQDLLYCSEAIAKAVREGIITEPGRYFAFRRASETHDSEIQIYDVDYDAAPLKICRSLQDEIPTPVPTR